MMDASVTTQFNKVFHFSKLDSTAVAPPAETESWFSSSSLFSLPGEDRFAVLRDGLNEVKSRLNRIPLVQWHGHTRARNPAGDVVPRLRASVAPELLTQAWCKLFECLRTFPRLDGGGDRRRRLCSAHLCEAPGAFVAALNHHLVTSSNGDVNWDWRASTLNPFHEGNSSSSMINDDRFVLHSLGKWHFGRDDTGDLLDPENRRDIVRAIRRELGSGGVDLVTADGSVDCQGDPARQETLVAPLHLSEAAAAISLLAPGGSMVLKMFTLFEQSSRSLMFLMAFAFEQLSVFKPATSKEGNSEVYVICLGFRDNLTPGQKDILMEKSSSTEHDLFQVEDVPAAFADEVFECASMFKELQCAVIERNLSSFEGDYPPEEKASTDCLRKSVAEHFMTRYRVRAISRGDFVTAGRDLQSVQQCLHLDDRMDVGTFEDRKTTESRPRTLEDLKRDVLSARMKRGDFRQVEWVKGPSVTTCEQQITYGKPISAVRCSRFCPGRMIDLCWEAWKLSQSAGDEGGGPVKRRRTGEDAGDRLESSWREHQAKLYSICPFLEGSTTVFKFGRPDFLLSSGEVDRATLIADLRRLVDLLLDEELAGGTHLTVCGLRPLTRLGVGILVALSTCFKDVGLARPRGECNCVVFCDHKGDPHPALDLLRQLLEALEGETGTLQVVQVFPMDSLGSSKLHHLLVKYNFYMVKEFTLSLINRLERQASSVAL